MFLLIFIKTNLTIGTGDYQVSKFPCKATLKRRVYSNTSSSRSNPFLVLFFHDYNMTFRHYGDGKKSRSVVSLLLLCVLNTDNCQANGTPTFRKNWITSQTWVCFRITWSTYYIDGWILPSEVLILEIGVGQKNLVFWQVPRWCRCCQYKAHLENYRYASETLPVWF